MKMFVKNTESRRFFSFFFLFSVFYERVARSMKLGRMERLRMGEKERNQK